MCTVQSKFTISEVVRIRFWADKLDQNQQQYFCGELQNLKLCPLQFSDSSSPIYIFQTPMQFVMFISRHRCTQNSVYTSGPPTKFTKYCFPFWRLSLDYCWSKTSIRYLRRNKFKLTESLAAANVCKNEAINFPQALHYQDIRKSTMHNNTRLQNSSNFW